MKLCMFTVMQMRENMESCIIKQKYHEQVLAKCWLLVFLPTMVVLHRRRNASCLV